MEFFVYSRSLVEAVAPHEVPHLIISITTTVDDRARLRTNEYTVGVLRQSFLDRETSDERVTEDQLFSDDQARQLLDFVMTNIRRATNPAVRIVAHCDAGVSRSAAVAAALSKILVGDDTELFERYRPNMRVYRKILQAHAEVSPT